ncbi:MAG: sigma-70 family RNA polymerase sigma factor, partial [Bacteroidales bacterium]
CRQGDASAWRVLIGRYTPLVYRLALRMLRHQEAAEDAGQEAFLRMFKSLESYNTTRPFGPWAAKITYNVCLRKMDSKSAAILSQAVDLDPDSMGDQRYQSPEFDVQRLQTDQVLEQAMGQLSAQDRAMLTMRYREGLSTAEVAEAVSMPVNTVKGYNAGMCLEHTYIFLVISFFIRKDGYLWLKQAYEIQGHLSAHGCGFNFGFIPQTGFFSKFQLVFLRKK